MIATICLYTLVSVSVSVSVNFSALYLISKVSEKRGIGPPLMKPFYTDKTILERLINDMKTQSKRKRYHSPNDIDSIWQILYPKHFINVLLIHHIKQREEVEIAKIASIMRDGLMHCDDSSSPQLNIYLYQQMINFTTISLKQLKFLICLNHLKVKMAQLWSQNLY